MRLWTNTIGYLQQQQKYSEANIAVQREQLLTMDIEEGERSTHAGTWATPLGFAGDLRTWR